MADSKLSDVDLHRELTDIGDEYPPLAEDQLFVLWFIRAFLSESLEEAANSLTGGPNDKGIDAILEDRDTNNIFVVQGKYRESIGKKRESRSDIISFCDVAARLASEKGEFDDWVNGSMPDLEQRLKRCRRHVLRDNYGLQPFYVTTGSVSKQLESEAVKRARWADHESRYHVIDGKRVLLLLSDYLDGVAPPVPSLDLEMESSSKVQIKGTYHRYDVHTDIESWVFSMSGRAVGDLYRQAGDRLFARNIRGFLGTTSINRAIEATIENEPQFFWYYNNGITIICDKAQQISSRGTTFLRASNPQVINGLQTTRTLARSDRKATASSVLVKVVRVPRQTAKSENHFEGLVSQIVSATNWQNAIRPSDLMANDRQQVQIQRQLRKLGYWYIRKRQTKSEARRMAGSVRYHMVQKHEFAQAVAGCNLDPYVIRRGRERLFEERWYPTIFPHADPHYYLPRYWLMRRVEAVARGFPERAYAKWVVLNFMWARLERTVRGRSGADKFRRASERHASFIYRLDKAINSAFVAALRFYRANRGKGAQAIDVSTYFQRRNLHDDFAKHWRSRANTSRRPFNSNWKKFERGLARFE